MLQPGQQRCTGLPRSDLSCWSCICFWSKEWSDLMRRSLVVSRAWTEKPLMMCVWLHCWVCVRRFVEPQYHDILRLLCLREIWEFSATFFLFPLMQHFPFHTSVCLLIWFGLFISVFFIFLQIRWSHCWCPQTSRVLTRLIFVFWCFCCLDWWQVIF